MPFSAIASTLGSILGSVDNNKAMRMQKEENEKTRQYNMQLAKQQNQWNIEQWNRENQYNDPSQQMERYKKAGLNPDLIYNNQNLSASSPNLTAGSPATPTDYSNRKNLGEIIANSANMALAISQSRKNNAEAHLLEEQTPSLTEKVREEVNEIRTRMNLTNKQAEKVGQEMDNLVTANSLLNEEVNKMKQEISNLKEDEVSKKIDNAVKSALKDKQIESELYKLGISKQHAEAELQTAMSNALASEKNAELIEMNVTNEQDFRSVLKEITKDKVWAIIFERFIRAFEGTKFTLPSLHKR